jgi:putative membrane protein
MWGYHNHHGWGAGQWFGMGFMMLILVALVVVATILVVRLGTSDRLDARPRPRQFVNPAEAVLEERFARGEIDADEFQRRRDVLRGHGS